MLLALDLFYLHKIIKMKKILYITTTTIAILFIGCSSNESQINPITDGYDRKSMLVNIADNIIIPSYNNLDNKILDLKTSTDIFSQNITTENLNDLRDKWLKAYTAWQRVEMFNIGKSEEIFYIRKMNTYPTDVPRIEANIESSSYDLVNQSNNYDAQGFPALDYMLYGLNGDSMLVLDKYTSNNGYKYMSYLADLVLNIQQNTNLIKEYWNSNRDAFVNSDGNTATSSLNLLTNDFIYYYEKGLRANKIGIPAGRFSSSILPNKVEAYFRKDVSKKLALEAINACHNFFIGKAFSSDQTGESLRTYINYIDKNNTLSNNIISKLENAREKIETLNNNFVEQIETNNMEMLYTYDAVQEVVIELKTEMLFSLNISVDYIDADGD